MSVSLTPADLAVRSGLVEDLPGEPPQHGPGILPGVGGQTGLEAGVLQEFLLVPPVLGGDLGKEQSSPSVHLYHEPVRADPETFQGIVENPLGFR
jgi:hypothetical protein